MTGPAELLLLALGFGALALKVWAVADAVSRPGPAYEAAGKLKKPIWLVILVAALVLQPTQVLGLFGLLGLVAAIVYLVDVRPAVRELKPGGPWGP